MMSLTLRAAGGVGLAAGTVGIIVGTIERAWSALGVSLLLLGQSVLVIRQSFLLPPPLAVDTTSLLPLPPSPRPTLTPQLERQLREHRQCQQMRDQLSRRNALLVEEGQQTKREANSMALLAERYRTVIDELAQRLRGANHFIYRIYCRLTQEPPKAEEDFTSYDLEEVLCELEETAVLPQTASLARPNREVAQ